MVLPKYTALRQKVINMAGCGGIDAQPVSESREEILAYVDALIERGDKGLYVMKALLMASDDWATCKIVRNAMFTDICTPIQQSRLVYERHGTLPPCIDRCMG